MIISTRASCGLVVTGSALRSPGSTHSGSVVAKRRAARVLSLFDRLAASKKGPERHPDEQRQDEAREQS